MFKQLAYFFRKKNPSLIHPRVTPIIIGYYGKTFFTNKEKLKIHIFKEDAIYFSTSGQVFHKNGVFADPMLWDLPVDVYESVYKNRSLPHEDIYHYIEISNITKLPNMPGYDFSYLCPKYILTDEPATIKQYCDCRRIGVIDYVTPFLTDPVEPVPQDLILFENIPELIDICYRPRKKFDLRFLKKKNGHKHHGRCQTMMTT